MDLFNPHNNPVRKADRTSLHYNEDKEAEPQRGSLPNDGKNSVTPQVYRPESSDPNSRACSNIPSSLESIFKLE